MEAITDSSIFGHTYINGMLISSIYNAIARFAVPCFIMLSGAYALSDKRNINCRYYYNKTVIKVFLPTFIFSLLYFFYSFTLELFSFVTDKSKLIHLFIPLKNWLIGMPFSHLWYLYMMIGIYLLVPFLILIKNHIGQKAWQKLSVFLLIISSIGYLTSTELLKWDIGYSVRFIGYFMIGDVIKSKGETDHKSESNRNSIVVILVGFSILLIVAFLRFQQALGSVSDMKLKVKLLDPLCPWIILASVLIFYGFSCLKCKKDYSKLAKKTFYIYLFHAGIWSICFMIIARIGSNWSNIIVIPAGIIVTFALSYFGTIIYEKIYYTVNKQLWIEDKITNWFNKT